MVAGSLAVLAAPSATADPRGVFLCVENASDGPVRLLMWRENDTNAPGPNILQPGWSRCAESTPQVNIGIRPGEDDIVSETNFSWLVSARRAPVVVGYGVQSRRAGWVRVRTPITWASVEVGQIRRATVPANYSPDGRPWLFVLQRFPNNEHVGGGLDTSGNQWIRYLLKVKATN